MGGMEEMEGDLVGHHPPGFSNGWLLFVVFEIFLL